VTALARRGTCPDGEAIGNLAADCLKLEIATYPKPGLVSPVDTGAHNDMDAAMMLRSAKALAPFFVRLANVGAAGAGMDRLRVIGIEAEAAMMVATGGVNTHRGAIFGMGLLCAAAGLREAYHITGSLGRLVAHRWGTEIAHGPVPLRSHGAAVARRYGAGGARLEAAAGFPSIYTVALPALASGSRLQPGDGEAARVQALMTLIGGIADTNLLHRGGEAGLAFAQAQAREFVDAGGVGVPDWRQRAIDIHHAFVARWLSPGGCADLLAMALFVRACGP
jgi:triphosphoribosyl-dephospho-CoA synthase